MTKRTRHRGWGRGLLPGRIDPNSDDNTAIGHDDSMSGLVKTLLRKAGVLILTVRQAGYYVLVNLSFAFGSEIYIDKWGSPDGKATSQLINIRLCHLHGL